jgi:hypothetical protein
MCTYLLLQPVQNDNDVLTAHSPVEDVSGGSRHILMPTIHTSRVFGHLTIFFLEKKDESNHGKTKGGGGNNNYANT